MAGEVRQMASDLSYWMPDDEEMYFSLGGYQAKTARHRLSDGSWARPYGSVPTTHILKPSPLTQQASAIVEHVCLELARRLGMSAAESEMATYGETNVCVISRYDRQESNGVWLRVHQEDMCQALGRQPQDKYEAHGGGNSAGCRADHERSARPIPIAAAGQDAEAAEQACLRVFGHC